MKEFDNASQLLSRESYHHHQLLLLYVCSSVIVNDAVFVSSMSVDWLSRRLYWVDTAKVSAVLLTCKNTELEYLASSVKRKL